MSLRAFCHLLKVLKQTHSGHPAVVYGLALARASPQNVPPQAQVGEVCDMQAVSTCSLFISQDRENGSLGFPVKAIYCPLVYLSQVCCWVLAEGAGEADRTCMPSALALLCASRRHPHTLAVCQQTSHVGFFSSVGKVATQISLFLLYQQGTQSGVTWHGTEESTFAEVQEKHTHFDEHVLYQH